jgi:hypothetical protein
MPPLRSRPYGMASPYPLGSRNEVPAHEIRYRAMTQMRALGPYRGPRNTLDLWPLAISRWEEDGGAVADRGRPERDRTLAPLRRGSCSPRRRLQVLFDGLENRSGIGGSG